MTIGWAVLGTGRQVEGRMAPALQEAGETHLAAVCSRDVSKAQSLADQFGFARAYGSYDEMLADRDVDVVYICTPNSLHAEHAIEAARAGKHVLVEKPMSVEPADAERMIAEAEAHGVRLGVGFQFRQHPAQMEARRLIAEGHIGTPFWLEARRIVAGPMLQGWWQDPAMAGAYITMTRGVHLMDLVCYLSGREPVAVTMMTDGQRPDHPQEETAVATIRLEGDCFATLVASRHGALATDGFVVHGTKGFVQASDTVKPGGSLRVVVEGSDAETAYPPESLYTREVDAFNRWIATGEPTCATGADGLRAVRLARALLQSARTGQTVAVER